MLLQQKNNKYKYEILIVVPHWKLERISTKGIAFCVCFKFSHPTMWFYYFSSMKFWWSLLRCEQITHSLKPRNFLSSAAECNFCNSLCDTATEFRFLSKLWFECIFVRSKRIFSVGRVFEYLWLRSKFIFSLKKKKKDAMRNSVSFAYATTIDIFLVQVKEIRDS